MARKAHKTLTLKVSITVPADTPVADVRGYVKHAVGSYGGGGHPNDWSFGLTAKDVEVVSFKPSKKEPA